MSGGGVTMTLSVPAPPAGTSRSRGTNSIQLAAERGLVPGAENVFSFFSLNHRSVTDARIVAAVVASFDTVS